MPFRGHSLHFAAVSGDRITLEVKERGADQLGTRNVKRLRRQGLIPGVLYGKANKAFVVGERELRIALTGPSGPQRDRRRPDRRPEDPAPRRAQGLPAASGPRHDHARRLPRGPTRPADPGHRARAPRRRVARCEGRRRRPAGHARAQRRGAAVGRPGVHRRRHHRPRARREPAAPGCRRGQGRDVPRRPRTRP